MSGGSRGVPWANVGVAKEAIIEATSAKSASRDDALRAGRPERQLPLRGRKLIFFPPTIGSISIGPGARRRPLSRGERRTYPTATQGANMLSGRYFTAKCGATGHVNLRTRAARRGRHNPQKPKVLRSIGCGSGACRTDDDFGLG